MNSIHFLGGGYFCDILRLATPISTRLLALRSLEEGDEVSISPSGRIICFLNAKAIEKVNEGH